MTKARRIALLFNPNTAFNRSIMAGIAAYFGSMGAVWELFVEEDFRLRLSGRPQGPGRSASILAPFLQAVLAVVDMAASISKARNPRIAL